MENLNQLNILNLIIVFLLFNPFPFSSPSPARDKGIQGSRDKGPKNFTLGHLASNLIKIHS
jgi:hypothetical protein